MQGLSGFSTLFYVASLTCYRGFKYIETQLVLNTHGAIGKIASEVPEVLEDKRINRVVIQRIHDTSPSVRDAAIDVMSRYLNRLDTIPEQLYKIISARIMVCPI